MLNLVTSKNILKIESWRDKFVHSNCLTSEELRSLEYEFIPKLNEAMAENSLERIADLLKGHWPK